MLSVHAYLADFNLCCRYLHSYHKLTESIDAHLYERHNRECIAHLLNVVCGLDSLCQKAFP